MKCESIKSAKSWKNPPVLKYPPVLPRIMVQSFWRTRRNTLRTSNIKFLFIPAVELFRRPRRNPLTRQFTCDLSLLNTLAELKWLQCNDHLIEANHKRTTTQFRKVRLSTINFLTISNGLPPTSIRALRELYNRNVSLLVTHSPSQFITTLPTSFLKQF